MKKTVSVGLGGRNFIFEEDAYSLLDSYIDSYSASLSGNKKEVMEEVEARFADLLQDALGSFEVVSVPMVDVVAIQMGFTKPAMPKKEEDSSAEAKQSKEDENKSKESQEDNSNPRNYRKFFRDTDDRKIGGVCSGLAHYFDIDVVLVRIIFLVALFCGTAGFWIYIIICIAAPSAYTAAEKCQMRGMPCTAENIRKFVDTKR